MLNVWKVSHDPTRLPSTHLNHYFCGPPIISIQGFKTRHYKKHGYGSVLWCRVLKGSAVDTASTGLKNTGNGQALSLSKALGLWRPGAPCQMKSYGAKIDPDRP